MQWGHIKTLFIICFLILDIFLVLQMIEKREMGDISALESTSNNRMDTLNANYEGTDKLSEESITDSYLYLSPREFTEADLSVFESEDNQQTALVNNQHMLLSKFEEPVPVPVEGTREQIETAVKDVALLAENYRLWGQEENTDILIFFQENGNKPIYYSQSGLLLVFLNEKNEMVQYVQTEMEKVEEEQEEKELISSVNAVFYLSNVANELLIGDEFTKVALGYHTLISNPDNLQVFVPSWGITVNNNRDYLVNAIEAGALPRDNSSFLKETLTDYRNKMNELEMSNPVVDEVRNQTELILETTTWSEENDD